jgi:hypothetical protein
MKESKEMVNVLRKSGQAAKFMSTSEVLFLIPYLNFILKPSIQSVGFFTFSLIHLCCLFEANAHLQSGNDMALVYSLAKKMSLLGLTYAHRQDENALALSFIGFYRQLGLHANAQIPSLVLLALALSPADCHAFTLQEAVVTNFQIPLKN